MITGRKNKHGQSELALNELNFKTLKERNTQFGASLMCTSTALKIDRCLSES